MSILIAFTDHSAWHFKFCVTEIPNTISVLDVATGNAEYTAKLAWSIDNESVFTTSSSDIDSVLHSVSNAWSVLNLDSAVLQLTVYAKNIDDINKLCINDILVNGEAISHDDILISAVDGYRGIVTPQISNLFQPYNNLQTSIDRELAVAQSITNIFGHPVMYIRVLPDDLNATFREYENFKAEGVKTVKVLVPDNDFKTAVLQYLEYGVSFEQNLEFHICVEEYERAFGLGARPNARDIIYVPKTNRLYDVVSATPVNGLDMSEVYTVLMLSKHKHLGIDMTNVDKRAFDINAALDFNIDAIDSQLLNDNEIETANVEIFKSLDNDNTNAGNGLITKAVAQGIDAEQKHQYYWLSKHELVRKQVHKDATIKHTTLSINSAPILYRHYDLSSIDVDDVAVKYNAQLDTHNTKLTIAQWYWGNDDANLLTVGMLTLDIVNAQLIAKWGTNIVCQHSLEEQWHFVVITIDTITHVLNVDSYEFVNGQFSHIETYTYSHSNIEILQTTDITIGGGGKIGWLKLYNNILILGTKQLSLALNKNYTTQNSLLIDTVFDLPKASL